MRLYDVEDLEHGQDALLNCLKPLLTAHRWSGDLSSLLNALPIKNDDGISLNDFRSIMDQLDFDVMAMQDTLSNLDDRLIPCVMMTEMGDAWVIMSKQGEHWMGFEGRTGAYKLITDADIKGQLLVAKPKPEETRVHQLSWWRQVIADYRGLLAQVCLMTFVLTLLSIGVPIFVMAVYNKVVRSGSLTMLLSFVVAMILVLIGLAVLQYLRRRIFAFISTKLDQKIGATLFERLLFLPPRMTETANVGAQLARIRQFESIRKFITSPLLNLVIELPFLILYFLAIAWLAPSVVWIPIALLIFVVIYSVFSFTRRSAKTASQIKELGDKQEFILEAIQSLPSIRLTASQGPWIERYKNFSASTALTASRLSFFGEVHQAIADGVILLAGFGVVVIGVQDVLYNEMGVGALIASMMLVWRVLMPMRQVFVAVPQLKQLAHNMSQVGGFLKIPLETEPYQDRIWNADSLKGDLHFDHVSFRHGAQDNFALSNVSFKLNAGQMAVVLGRSGSGRTALLKVIPNFYQPQAGTIALGGHDIRQISPINLRQKVLYVPSKGVIFTGSLHENLRMASPEVTQEQMHQALALFGIDDVVTALPEGLNTQSTQLPESIDIEVFTQLFCLARAWLARPEVLLIDDQRQYLPAIALQQLAKALKTLKGNTTILIASRRIKPFDYADRVFVLDKGELLLQGSPEQVQPKLPQYFW